MPTIPLNITGGNYAHKSRALSSQITRNFWPQKQDNIATKSQYILEGWVGQKLFGSAPGKNRGIFEHQDIVYKVSGTTLYQVDSAGIHTAIGTIPGNGRCRFAPIVSNVVIVSGGFVYYWNGTVLAPVLDSDLEQPNAAAHLNSQIIYDGDDGRFVTSDVGDATTISGLNYASAESAADDLLRVYVFDQTAYMLGTKTIEPWWNSGVGSPPFDRIESGIMSIGLGALDSVSNDDNYMYLLGDDNKVYRIKGSSFQKIANLPTTRALELQLIISDAIGWNMSLQGQNFYVLALPTMNKTMVFPEDGDMFEWSSGVNGGRNNADGYVYAFRKHLVADYRNGNIYELDFETYTENGAPIIRTRIAGPLHSGLFGKPGKDFEFNRFELIMETGVGIIDGQGSDPVVMLKISYDDGKTFQDIGQGQIGKMGIFTKVEWFELGTCASAILEISISDPVYASIHSAAADIELCI